MNPQNRINDPKTIDTNFIDKELKAGKDVVVQFSTRGYDEKKLAQLNELCGRYDKNFEIRFYGHYSNSFDCKTLLKIPNVKSLYVDCLKKAHNVEVISGLKNLQKLSLGIYEMKETEILNAENRKLKTLLIEDNIQLQTINFDSSLPYLNDLKILNCKTLHSLTGLELLPSLHQLRIYKTALDFDKLIMQPLPKTLKIFAFYTPKNKINKDIKATLEMKGYSER